MELSAPVGAGGTNRGGDVLQVQRGLNEAMPFDGVPLVIDGVCGPRTIDKIVLFQRRFMNHPDGRIDPLGATHRRINRIIPPEGWRGTERSWKQSKKESSLHPALLTVWRRIKARLLEIGHRPIIHYGWRSIRCQADIYRRGLSNVKFSFHNVQKDDGTPISYAIDAVDERYYWGPLSGPFFRDLGEQCDFENLYWGGHWRPSPDSAHLQLLPNYKLAELRKLAGL